MKVGTFLFARDVFRDGGGCVCVIGAFDELTAVNYPTPLMGASWAQARTNVPTTARLVLRSRGVDVWRGPVEVVEPGPVNLMGKFGPGAGGVVVPAPGVYELVVVEHDGVSRPVDVASLTLTFKQAGRPVPPVVDEVTEVD